MRFGIDLDGVLGDFGAEVVKVGNSLWPGKFPIGFVPDNWDYEGFLTAGEWAQIWVKIKSTPYFWNDESALVGVEELQNYLNPEPIQIGPNTWRSTLQREDEIFFVTARAVTVGDSPLVQSSHWLQSYGLWPRDGRSVVLPVADASHKADLIKALDIPYFLDDYAPTVDNLNRIESIQAYVLDQPWNRYASHLPRVFSVAEYLDTIRSLDASRVQKLR